MIDCEFEENGFCKASLTQNPVIPCEYADYNARSYFPPCSKPDGEIIIEMEDE